MCNLHGSSTAAHYPEFAEQPAGKRITKIYKSRVSQFVADGQYAGQNLKSKLVLAETNSPDAVSLAVYSPPDLARITFEEAVSHEFTPTKVGESFGPSWATHWFRVTVKVPDEIRALGHIEFHWDADNEGMIWAEAGHVVHGLTGGGERVEWILPELFLDGREHLFYVEMACNGMFGVPSGSIIQPPLKDKRYVLKEASLKAINTDARALMYDYTAVGAAVSEFPEDSWEAHEALNVCSRIIDTFAADDGSQDAIRECRKIAQEFLGPDVDSEKVYEQSGLAHRRDRITAVGHCHIDSCWLWPFAETRRKVARSWSSQLDLMDRYPELRFVCSQAQQYKWLEENYPELFGRVREKVKSGQFQPIGGSWVEHDTNMPSGESLVRQFVYGQRYFESRFGIRCKTFWLPDTFGYAAQLPQICRQAGMTRFFTQKLSWNNINEFPHTTFNWVALDGSQVICHMPPSETYTAEATMADIKNSISRHKTLDQDASSLLVFGKGDGGGGPTWGHLEKLRRYRGMSNTVGSLPRVEMNDSVDDFFDRIEKKVSDGVRFPTWHGELYFELHRGTYTTQARNKSFNRRAEALLREIEFLATVASVKAINEAKGFRSNGEPSYRYPKEELDKMWELTLLCQFHDCLPGSSIRLCYDESDKMYETVFETGERIMGEALAALGLSLNAKEGFVPVSLCTLHWPWLNTLPGLGGDGPETSLFHGAGLSPIIPLQHSKGDLRIEQTEKDMFFLSNSRYAVWISNGAVTSIFDKKNDRELIPAGRRANQFVIYDDKPLFWQAWDVEVYHLESRKELQAARSMIHETGETGRVSVQTEIPISDKSYIVTTVSLTEQPEGVSTTVQDQLSPINVECRVEWHETMKFLKVEFPIDVVSSEASYETAFGIVRRPTHYNTSWDMARFEVCSHRWADLSEHGYGVAIVNESKYGFATVGNTMRLSLLRAPKAPDASADMGSHVIKYAILPHSGGLDHRVVRAAYAFNSPVRTVYRPVSGAGSDVRSTSRLLSSIRLVGDPAVVLDTVKKAEDGTNAVIVRMYESLGGRARTTVVWDSDMYPVKRVFATNVLEDTDPAIAELLIDEESASQAENVCVPAFGICTLRLEM